MTAPSGTLPDTYIEGPHRPNPELCKPCWSRSSERLFHTISEIEHFGDFSHLTSLGKVSA